MTASRSTQVLWLVAGREIKARIRSRSFLLSTAFLAVVLVAIGVLNRVLSDDGPDPVDVAVVGLAPDGFEQVLQQAADGVGRELTIEVDLALEAAEDALADGDVDVVVAIDDGQALFDDEVDEEAALIVDSAWRIAEGARRAFDLGLSTEDVESVLSPEPLEVITLRPPDADDDDVARAVGSLAAILLFLCLNAFGSFVLTGVVEEKTSAVVELLLAQVRGHVLLAGKVLGIGVVALVQFSVIVVSGLVALAVADTDVPSEVWVSIPATLGWFVGGYALYSSLFALAGSFVSRVEDAQTAAAPITTVLIAAYIVVFGLVNDPDGTVARVLSLLPPSAPLVMPLRMAAGEAAAWEVAVSASLLAASVYGVLRAAGAIYASTLLHRGSRLTWRQSLTFRRTS